MLYITIYGGKLFGSKLSPMDNPFLMMVLVCLPTDFEGAVFTLRQHLQKINHSKEFPTIQMSMDQKLVLIDYRNYAGLSGIVIAVGLTSTLGY